MDEIMTATDTSSTSHFQHRGPSTFRVGLVEELLPGDLGFFRQGLQVVPRLHVDDAVQIFLRWGAEDACTERSVMDTFLYGCLERELLLRGQELSLTQYVVELVQVVFPREDRLVGQHLSQDAAHWPNVNGLRVALRQTHKPSTRWQSHFSQSTSVTHTPTLELSMISGALYQRVATYSVKKPVWSCSGSAILARPKSQIWGRHKGPEVRDISHTTAAFRHALIREAVEIQAVGNKGLVLAVNKRHMTSSMEPNRLLLPPLPRHQPRSECYRDLPVVVNTSHLENLLLLSSYVKVKVLFMSENGFCVRFTTNS